MDETQGTPNQTPQQPYQQQYQQPQYQQQQYQQPYQQQQYMVPGQKSDADLTLGHWLLTIFLTCIPIVGFVMMFVWSFGSATAPAKKNWARATLVWYIIGIVICIILTVLFGATIAALMASDPDFVASLNSSSVY